MPRCRSQRTMTRAATAEERKDLRAMDREVDSATTGTFDEYSPGERSQPHTYMVYMCPAQVSFLNHLRLLCHCVIMCNSLPSIDSLNQARLEYVGNQRIHSVFSFLLYYHNIFYLLFCCIIYVVVVPKLVCVVVLYTTI